VIQIPLIPMRSFGAHVIIFRSTFDDAETLYVGISVKEIILNSNEAMNKVIFHFIFSSS
jgi:hypothetical protein